MTGDKKAEKKREKKKKKKREVPLYIHIYIYRPRAKHASSSDRDRAGEHHRPHLARRAARTGIESLDKEVRLP